MALGKNDRVMQDRLLRAWHRDAKQGQGLLEVLQGLHVSHLHTAICAVHLELIPQHRDAAAIMPVDGHQQVLQGQASHNKKSGGSRGHARKHAFTLTSQGSRELNEQGRKKSHVTEEGLRCHVAHEVDAAEISGKRLCLHQEVLVLPAPGCP